MATDKVRVVGWIKRDLHAKVVRTSARLGVSRSLILEQALSSWLGQDSLSVLNTKKKRNGHSRER